MSREEGTLVELMPGTLARFRPKGQASEITGEIAGGFDTLRSGR
jgi:hypothetical protein